MGLVGYVMNSKIVKCVKRNFTILTVDLTAAIGLVHLWNKGYKYLVPTVSLCYIGGTYLYCRIKSRDEISSSQAIIIIGCDSGLGYSLALHCRQLGAAVIASVLQINGPGASKLQEEGVFVYSLDVTKPQNVSHFATSVQILLSQQNLELRCLINNAAVMIFGEFEWQTDEQIRNQVEVNLLGSMRVTRELMPIIRAHSSRIIVISSHCNIQPIPGVATYSATKAGLTAWAKALRLEVKKYGVKVVCFIPGSFIGKSNIMARQSEHMQDMLNSMPIETQNFYGDYLSSYFEYFSSVTQGTKLEKLQDTRIYQKFEGALLDKYPSAIYKNESWRYFIYHTLFAITPTCLSDVLVLKFVRGPPWKGPMIQDDEMLADQSA